jgi:hypothetical protein
MNFVDIRAQSTSFDRMAAYAIRNVVLSGAGGAELAEAVKMTPGLFDTLGVHVAKGRPFRDDEQHDRARVVILNDSFWASRFGSRPPCSARRSRSTTTATPSSASRLPGSGWAPRSPRQSTCRCRSIRSGATGSSASSGT